MKILLTEPQEISQKAIDILIANDHQVVTACATTPDRTIDGLFIRTYTRVTSEYLDQFPALTMIIRAGSGLDNIDLIECKNRQIQVFSSPGANSNSVAEHVLSMMLMLLKKTSDHINNLKQNVWRTHMLLGTELKGKTIGLIGCGAVGQKLAQLLAPFEVTLLGYDKYVDSQIMVQQSISPVSLEELLTQSDIISVQVPLTGETINLVGERELALMKESSHLINVSRGEVVSEPGLINALSTHHLAGAAIDVVVGEPNPNPRLFALDNLLITPHIAGFTQEADEAIAIEAVNNFLTNTKK